MVCFFSSRRRHTRCALVTGVQTCALPIFGWPGGGAGRCRRIEAAPLQHLRFRAPRATAARIMTDTHDLRAEALVSKAWPYEEARKLLKRYPSGKPGGAVLFETGYGPSGQIGRAHV